VDDWLNNDDNAIEAMRLKSVALAADINVALTEPIGPDAPGATEEQSNVGEAEFWLKVHWELINSQFISNPIVNATKFVPSETFCGSSNVVLSIFSTKDVG
jgi:hypothetical protein